MSLNKQLELTFLEGKSDTLSAAMTLSEAEGVVADAVDRVSLAGYSAPSPGMDVGHH